MRARNVLALHQKKTVNNEVLHKRLVAHILFSIPPIGGQCRP